MTVAKNMRAYLTRNQSSQGVVKREAGDLVILMASVEGDASVSGFDVPDADAGIVRRRHHLFVKWIVDGAA